MGVQYIRDGTAQRERLGVPTGGGESPTMPFLLNIIADLKLVCGYPQKKLSGPRGSPGLDLVLLGY
jgi:hypothetical protein